MIRIETYTVANLARAKIGERFDFKAHPYRVQAVDVYLNPGGQERMAVTLKTHCAACGELFEFTTNRRAKWLRKTCPKHKAAP